jgi:hypothetical protein
MRNRHFFLNSAILGSIALRLMLIEMVNGEVDRIDSTNQAPPLSEIIWHAV